MNGITDSSTTVLKKKRSHSFHGKSDRKSSKQLRRQMRTDIGEKRSVDGLVDRDLYADDDCVRSGARSILLTEDNLNNLENHARQRESSSGPDLILDLPSR